MAREQVAPLGDACTVAGCIPDSSRVTIHIDQVEYNYIRHGSIVAEWREVALGTGGHVVKSWLYPLFSACYCCYSVSKSRPTLSDPMDCSMLGFLVLHHPPDFARIHVH